MRAVEFTMSIIKMNNNTRKLKLNTSNTQILFKCKKNIYMNISNLKRPDGLLIFEYYIKRKNIEIKLYLEE